MSLIINEDLPLTEPSIVADIYSDGLAKVEDLGVCARLIYFTYQPPERVVVAKIVRPWPCLLRARALITAALAEHDARAAGLVAIMH